MATEVVLLHNKNAGAEHPSRKELVGMLKDAGYKARYHELHAALEKPELMARGDFVAVAGGDGSVRKVVRLLLGNEQKRFAPLPLGTANNISRSLGLGGEIERIIHGWPKSRLRKFDVGTIEGGPGGKQTFIEGIGVGLIPHAIAVIQDIDRASEREFRTLADKLHRDHCVFTALAYEVDAQAVKMEADERDLSGDYLLLEILNIGRAGPGLHLAPRADPSDGKLDLASARRGERRKLISYLKEDLFGAEGETKLRSIRARHLQLTLKSGELRIDDKVFPLESRTRLTIGLIPAALAVLVP